MKIRFILAAALLGLTPGAHANHIDFLVDAGFSVTESTGFMQFTGAGGNILGAVRGVQVTSVGSANASLGVPPGPGPVGFDNSITLDYIGDPDSALLLSYLGNGGGGVDLVTAANYNSFEFLFSEVNGSFALDVMVGDAAGGNGTASRTVNSAGITVLPYGEFAGVDFTSVNTLDITLDTTAGGSFALASITRARQVSEPSTGALFGLSGILLGLAGLSHRRRRQL